MGMTVSGDAAYYINSYNLSKSEAAADYSVDSSTVSKSCFNVSDITNAIEALGNTDSISIGLIGKVTDYANNTYSLSQLSSYSTLKKAAASISDVSNIITNNTDLSGIYDNLYINVESATEYIESLTDTTASDTQASAYSSYLNETIAESSINILV